MNSSAECTALHLKEFIMTKTNTLLASLLMAASIGLAATPAMARPMDCDGMGMQGERGPGKHAERMKQRQQQLHDALKLNADQEKAWVKFQESHPAMGNKANWPDRAAIEKLPAPERAEKMLEMSRKHQDLMAQHVAALKVFYEVLTPEQRKIFDAHPMKRGPRANRPATPPNPS
jgi:periplasmic protein CpxP/Spy